MTPAISPLLAANTSLTLSRLLYCAVKVAAANKHSRSQLTQELVTDDRILAASLHIDQDTSCHSVGCCSCLVAVLWHAETVSCRQYKTVPASLSGSACEALCLHKGKSWTAKAHTGQAVCFCICCRKRERMSVGTSIVSGVQDVTRTDAPVSVQYHIKLVSMVTYR